MPRWAALQTPGSGTTDCKSGSINTEYVTLSLSKCLRGASPIGRGFDTTLSRLLNQRGLGGGFLTSAETTCMPPDWVPVFTGMTERGENEPRWPRVCDLWAKGPGHL